MASNPTNKRMSLQVEGLEETVREFRNLSREVKDDADEQVRAIAKLVAADAKAAARTPAELKASGTIKAQKNSVSLGGGGKRNRAGNMALGTEFGGRRRPTTQQFRPHEGKVGYFFWPSLRDNERTIKKMWDDLLADLVED